MLGISLGSIFSEPLSCTTPGGTIHSMGTACQEHSHSFCALCSFPRTRHHTLALNQCPYFLSSLSSLIHEWGHSPWGIVGLCLKEYFIILYF